MFRKRAGLRAEAAATAHAYTEKIVRSLPNATAVFLPGGHPVAAGNPGAFNASVLDFLKDVQEASRVSR